MSPELQSEIGELVTAQTWPELLLTFRVDAQGHVACSECLGCGIRLGDVVTLSGDVADDAEPPPSGAATPRHGKTYRRMLVAWIARGIALRIKFPPIGTPLCTCRIRHSRTRRDAAMVSG